MKRSLITAILLLLTATDSYAMSESGCALSDEKEILDLKALQSHLMVGALSCEETENYNRFMEKFGNAISGGFGSLQEYFFRNYGELADAELDQFITGLANRESRKSLKISEDKYCDKVHSLFEKLEDVADLKTKTYIDSGIRSCTSQEARRVEAVSK